MRHRCPYATESTEAPCHVFPQQGSQGQDLAGYTSLFITVSVLGGMVIYSQVKTAITRNIQSELNNTTGVLRNMVQTAAGVSVKN
ncbi:MAG: hypothetical protein V1793_04450 [Pseudomonadota bacterium]